MKPEPKYERTPIYSLDEIPDFANEDEERDFWAEHEFSDELWDSLPDMTAELDEIAPLPQEAEGRKRAPASPYSKKSRTRRRNSGRLSWCTQ
jgi:hypothetical protein